MAKKTIYELLAKELDRDLLDAAAGDVSDMETAILVQLLRTMNKISNAPERAIAARAEAGPG